MDSSRLLFAVFGNPVLHSRSPQIYNSLFKRDQIAACYTRILTHSGKAVCELIRNLGLSGANITTPFKEQVVPFLDSISPKAAAIGAVNTIINARGTLAGHNTDPDGVTGSLREAGINPEGMNCMVMGAGGAGKAAALGLMEAGADVLLTNRNAIKAHEFAEKTGCRSATLNEAVKQLRNFDLLVIAMPPGVYPFSPADAGRGLVIVDANYRSDSGSVRSEEYSSPVIRGDRWLLHQATGAYRLFTGRSGDSRAMERGLGEYLDPVEVTIEVLRDFPCPADFLCRYDLLVDGRNLDHNSILSAINEEKSKAFGS